MLAKIGESPRYGGELIQFARESISEDVKIPTVYAILKRCEAEGVLSSFEMESKDDVTRGTSRQYYELTEAGKKHFAAISEIIESSVSVITKLTSTVKIGEGINK